MAKLEVKDLQVYYGVIQALKGISFEVNQGEVIALIGANGAGKTTTLQTLTGILSPKSGSIVFEGKDLTRTPAHKIVEMGMAHVPEGRRVFADMSVYDVDSAMTFKRFLEKTFDVMFDVDGKVLTEEERKVAEKAKAIAKNVGFEFNGAEGEYLVSAENDCIYTVNVEFRHNDGIEISEFYDGLICTNLAEPFDCFDESDFEYDLKEAIGNVAASALSNIVSYLNDDCDECIEDTFDTNNEEIGIDFKGREKSDAILVFFDKEMKSIIMRDVSGDTMVTDFSNFVEEFTDFCREKLGEEYTENWVYANAY